MAPAAAPPPAAAAPPPAAAAPPPAAAAPPPAAAVPAPKSLPSKGILDNIPVRPAVAPDALAA